MSDLLGDALERFRQTLPGAAQPARESAAGADQGNRGDRRRGPGDDAPRSAEPRQSAGAGERSPESDATTNPTAPADTAPKSDPAVND
jgi:hypothetical protein